jgi:transcriptional regulator with XRE-family HTH domain
MNMATLTSRDLLAINVEREMHARGWTQVELADKCELSQPRVSELLKGTYGSRMEIIDRIAKAFGVHPSALLMPPIEDES